jgi:hypothetical protein
VRHRASFACMQGDSCARWVCAGDGARGEAKSGSGLVMPPCRGVAASAAEMSVAGVVNEAGGWRKLAWG